MNPSNELRFFAGPGAPSRLRSPPAVVAVAVLGSCFPRGRKEREGHKGRSQAARFGTPLGSRGQLNCQAPRRISRFVVGEVGV